MMTEMQSDKQDIDTDREASTKPVTALIDIDTKQRYKLERTALISIGRDLENQIALPNDPAVSSCHALITFAKDSFWLEDLGTNSGTFLNDNRVTTPVVLSIGDSILVGRTRFTTE